MELPSEEFPEHRSRTINDSPEDFESPEALIRLERIRLTLTDVDTAGAGILITFIFATVAVWGHIPTSWIIVFWALLVTEVALKLKFSQDFKRDYTNYSVDMRKYDLGILVGSWHASIVYGISFLVIFMPMPEENRWLLAVCILSSILIISTFNSELPKAGWLPFLVLILPLCIALLFSGNIILFLIVLVIFTSMAVVILRGQKLAERLGKIIVYHKDNDALLQKLSIERTKAEEQREVAEQAVINKSKFIAAASHDLRQPLHALGLFQDSLKHGITDENLMPIVNSMEKSTSALRELFDDLLDVSRLDAGVVKPNLKDVSVESLCETLGVEFREIAKHQKCTLTIEHNDIAVFTDDHLIERIIRNLLTNAVKHTQEGEIKLSANALDDNYAELVIEDTGSGIDASQLEHIFKEYYQTDNSNHPPTSGFGLGLAIVNRIAPLLDISVSIESEIGEGTKVTLRVPIGDSTAVAQSMSETVSLPDVKSLNVAVLDDDEHILRGMQNALEQWGHEISAYSDAEALMSDLASNCLTPDIVIIDYHLGDQTDGLQVSSRIDNSIDSELKLVIITGESAPEHMTKLYNSKFDVLQKPVSPDDLQHYLSKLHEDAGSERASA